MHRLSSLWLSRTWAYGEHVASLDTNWESRRLVRAATALLEEARPIIDENLAGLNDDEYMWEPVPGCWSIRLREEIRSPICWGRHRLRQSCCRRTGT